MIETNLKLLPEMTGQDLIEYVGEHYERCEIRTKFGKSAIWGHGWACTITWEDPISLLTQSNSGEGTTLLAAIKRALPEELSHG